MANQASQQISAQDIFTVQTDQGSYLGQQTQTQDGRTFAYSLNGSGGALAAGKLVAATAATANHQSRTLAAGVIARSTSIVVPLGATLATAGQYANGYLVVVSGTGQGQLFVVKNNTAANSGASTTVTLDNKTPVLVALDTTSVVSLYPNPWGNVAISGTTVAQNITGVPQLAVPASNYFWGQVDGYATVLTDSAGAITKGNEVVPSTAVAGAVAAAGASAVTQNLGYVPEVTVASQYQPVVLQIL